VSSEGNEAPGGMGEDVIPELRVRAPRPRQKGAETKAVEGAVVRAKRAN
jgi:hypothetical protein